MVIKQSKINKMSWWIDEKLCSIKHNFCAFFICPWIGHKVAHEVWTSESPEYFHPEVNEAYYCSRCDIDL